MNINKKRLFSFACLIISSIGLMMMDSPDCQSAIFTKAEIRQVKKYQAQYKQINKEKYSKNNFLNQNQALPNYSILQQDYMSCFLDGVNYYRSLYQLPYLKLNSADTTNAQITAQVMANVNAPADRNEHGLPYVTKPSDLNSETWNIAKKTSSNSNLDFTRYDASGFDIVHDFFTDVHDLNGNDTGHRSWLISPYVLVTGFGSYYSPVNQVRYSVMPVLKPVKKTIHSKLPVYYPEKGVFPIEECRTNWSVYLLNKKIKRIPKITITDLDNQKKYKATNVRNYSRLGYGYFKTIIVYNKGKTKLIPGHAYRIKISGVGSYKFKLFNEKVQRVYKD